jgi:hypothetical protein
MLFGKPVEEIFGDGAACKERVRAALIVQEGARWPIADELGLLTQWACVVGYPLSTQSLPKLSAT